MQTVVGYFDSSAKANQVKSALNGKGYKDVTVIDQSAQTGEGYRTGYEGTNPEHDTLGGKIKHFFSGMTSDDDNTHEHYTRGVSAGGAIVSVKTDDDQVDGAADLLDSYGASDVQGDATGSNYTGSQGTGVYDAGDRNYGTGTGTVLAGSNDSNYADGRSTSRSADAGYDNRDANISDAQSIAVVQEELAVGKRQVRRGGVRVYSHLVSEPVSEQVSLHDERIVVDRRPVNRAATEADFTPGDRNIELTAMGEEAVVGKTSRVVEEVLVGKQATDRTQTINDSVRHTEVEVERVDGDEETATTSSNRY